MAETTTTEAQKRGKILSGVVVSNKMKDTVVVAVSHYVKHSKYKKYIKQMKRFQAHNPGNTKQVGEQVKIQETRPISKMKHFVVVETQ